MTWIIISESKKEKKADDFTFTAFDVETAHSGTEGICQIGIVSVVDGEIVERVKYLVQPPDNMYSKINISIHGISSKKTESAPTFDAVYPEISRFFEGKKVISHNEYFDIRVLKKNLDCYNIPHPKFLTTACTFKMTGIGLIKACQAYSVETGLHHDALADAEMCAALYMRIKQGFPRNDSLIFKEKKSDAINDRIVLDAAKTSDFFKNKNVVITGKFENFTREEMRNLIVQLGGVLRAIVSSKTDIVIVGMEAGSAKMAKIEEQKSARDSLTVLKEEEFIKIIN